MNSEEMTKLAARANEAIRKAGIVGITVYKGFDIDFSTMGFTPEWVRMQVDRVAVGGKPPRKQEGQTKEEHLANYKAWQVKAKAAGNDAFTKALAVLKKEKIRYRSGTEYDWPVARLA